MDNQQFSNIPKPTEPRPPSPRPQPINPIGLVPQEPKKAKSSNVAVIFIGLLAAVTLVVALVSVYLATREPDLSAVNSQNEELSNRLKALEYEDQYFKKEIKSDAYQAVFLEGGQVYFGKITETTKENVKLENIYYLKTGSVDKNGNPDAGTDVSLVKLGKELHAPEDKMIIERKNITFWENLKNDGEVAKAITEYKRAN